MRILYRPSKDIRSFPANAYIEKYYPEFLDEKNPELVLISGGDGAMLHAIQEYKDLKIPFFGYAAGTLNFLMNEIKFEDLGSIIDSILSNTTKLDVITTNKIKLSIKNKIGDIKVIGEAVNEVVFGGTIMGYHTCLISSCDGAFDNFEIKGTGICVSTDLGSTGFNFNLGGPILPIGSNLWSILGIGCNRYLEDIVNINKIELRFITSRSIPQIFIDGIDINHKPEAGDTLILEKGEIMKLAFLDKKDSLVNETKSAQDIEGFRKFNN